MKSPGSWRELAPRAYGKPPWKLLGKPLGACKIHLGKLLGKLLGACRKHPGKHLGRLVGAYRKLLSLPTPPERFFTISIKNAGYQSEPCTDSATKTTNKNLSIIIRI
jgi:hypothetical protein